MSRRQENPSAPLALLLVKKGQCPKLSARASGLLFYRLTRAAEGDELYLAITGNETAGYYSREDIPFARLEKVLNLHLGAGSPFPSSRLKGAFEGKSANNASFLAAILRHEGLLSADGDNPVMNRAGATSLSDWRQHLLSLPTTALPVSEPGKQESTSASANTASSTEGEGSVVSLASAKARKGKKGKAKSEEKPEAEPAADADTDAQATTTEGQDDAQHQEPAGD